MSESITTEIAYRVDGSGADTALVVYARGLCFRMEVIPDGEMDGMKGWREIPWEFEKRYVLGRAQALELARQLSEAAMRQDHRS